MDDLDHCFETNSCIDSIVRSSSANLDETLSFSLEVFDASEYDLDLDENIQEKKINYGEGGCDSSDKKAITAKTFRLVTEVLLRLVDVPTRVKSWLDVWFVVYTIFYMLRTNQWCRELSEDVSIADAVALEMKQKWPKVCRFVSANNKFYTIKHGTVSASGSKEYGACLVLFASKVAEVIVDFLKRKATRPDSPLSVNAKKRILEMSEEEMADINTDKLRNVILPGARESFRILAPAIHSKFQKIGGR
jgi:hypothetical protein